MNKEEVMKERYECILNEIKCFIEENKRFPKVDEFKIENSLHPYTTTVETLKFYGDSLSMIGERFNCTRKNSDKGYDYWLKQLLSICKDKKRPLQHREFKEYKLPTVKWFLDNCPNPKVENFSDFISIELNMVKTTGMTKEDATKVILKMAKNKDILMYKDFKENSQECICITTINRLWGNMNNMKRELGLEILQEDMLSRHKSKEEMLIDLNNLVYSLGRIPRANDINKCESMLGIGTYNRYFGGIGEALRLIGFTPRKKSISINMTNDEMIKIYKKYIDDNGFVMSYEFAKTIYSLPSPRTVCRRLNCSWNEFVEMLGYKPNESFYSKSKGKDGIICASSSEAVVHNHLLTLPIMNLKKEVYYKDIISNEELKEKSGFKRLDWVFDYHNQTYYVEYFGMMDLYNYTQRHNEKIDIITKDGKVNNFIALYPKDLKNLEILFKNKLNLEGEVKWQREVKELS